MLELSEQAIKELDFLRSLEDEDMDITIRRAQLIGKIESRSQDSEYANADEITIIQQELKDFREQIRELDK